MISVFPLRIGTAVALLAIGFQARGAEDEESRLNKSPYFIDGIHCEGLANRAPSEDSFRDKAAAAIGAKSVNQRVCEEVFAGYGLRKFEWRTPDDLEMLAFAIKNSNRYQSFELSIEKSQLQNHVHVYGRFTEFEARTHFTSAFQFRSDGPRGEAGPRRTYAVDATLELDRRGPANSPMGVITVKGRESRANDALTVADLDSDSENPLEFSAANDTTLAKTNESFKYASYRALLRRSSQSRVFAELGLVSQRLSDDEQISLDQQGQVGYSFENDDTDLFIGSTLTTWTLAALYSSYSALPEQKILKDQSSSTSKELVFIGVEQESNSQTFSFSWRYYRGVTSIVRYFGDADIQWTFAELGITQHALVWNLEAVEAPILPEHRFALDAQARMGLFYRLGMTLPGANGQHALQLKFGGEQVRYDGQRENVSAPDNDGVTISTPVFSLDYILKSANFDVQLGVAVAARRSR